MAKTKIDEFLERARARAAQSVETWFPKEEGDNRGGVIQSIKYLSLPFPNQHRNDGLTPSTVIEDQDGTVFRYNWVGTIPETTWEDVNPQVGDIVWVHHHGERPQRDEMNDYKLITTTVIDPTTGEEREAGSAKPVRPEDVPDNVDGETGEIKRTGDEEF